MLHWHAHLIGRHEDIVGVGENGDELWHRLHRHTIRGFTDPDGFARYAKPVITMQAIVDPDARKAFVFANMARGDREIRRRDWLALRDFFANELGVDLAEGDREGKAKTWDTAYGDLPSEQNVGVLHQKEAPR